LAQGTLLTKKRTFNCRDRLLDLSTPVAMGIHNIAPNSFFDCEFSTNEKEMLLHVEKMMGKGAAIIDVGVQSTRPGATLVSSLNN
jgi:dihydropteroate synthase